MKKKYSNGGLVYSTDGGRHCPVCKQAVAACACNESVSVAPINPGDNVVRVRRENKGRGGKTVTCISGIPLVGNALNDLAAELKKRCSSGGTIKNGIIEIQGEHMALLLEMLKQRGFRVKQSGG